MVALQGWILYLTCMELPGYDNWKLDNGYGTSRTVQADVTVTLVDVDGLTYRATFSTELKRSVAEDWTSYHDEIMDLLTPDLDEEWEYHEGQKYDIVAVDF